MPRCFFAGGADCFRDGIGSECLALVAQEYAEFSSRMAVAGEFEKVGLMSSH